MPRHAAVNKVNRDFEASFKQWRAPRSIGLRLLGDCMKRTILDLRLTGPGDPPDKKGMMNMSYGSAFENWMMERLKVSGLLKYGGILGKDNQVNVRVEQYYGNGYMDALVNYEKQDIGVEIKSCTAPRFNQLMKDRKPTMMHFYQLMAYLHFLKLKKGWLIYIDREKTLEDRNGESLPRWEIIEVEYDPVLGKKLEARLKKLNEYRLNGKVPPKEPKTSKDPKCTWCPYRKQCWGSQSASAPIGGNARAARIAKDSQARRRERTNVVGTKSAQKPK